MSSPHNYLCCAKSLNENQLKLQIFRGNGSAWAKALEAENLRQHFRAEAAEDYLMNVIEPPALTITIGNRKWENKQRCVFSYSSVS